MSEGTSRDSAKDTRVGLLKSTGVVSAFTMVSRVSGLLRDIVIANFFGSGAGADAFILAFRIPNLFRRLFAEGAFSQAFIPVLSEYRSKGSIEVVRDLISRVSGTLGLILLVITLFGVLGADYLIYVFAPGFLYYDDMERLVLATDMLRLTFPYLLLISMTALAGSILNTCGRFAVPAFTPVLLNLSLILSVVYLRPYLGEPVFALAWGVLIAGVAQLTFQLPFLHQQRLLVLPRPARHHPGVKKIMVLMLPALFAVSAGQINMLLDSLLASFLETGSYAWLYYSDRLLEFPLALFGIAIATVILPGLSADHNSESTEEFSKTLNWAIRLVVLFGLPATVALVYLSDSLIATVFFIGEFTERDIRMASLSLSAYGLGLLGLMLVKVLAPGYFARQDMSTPVRYAVVTLTTNMVLNLILIWHLRHAGLALATSLAAFVNAGLLFYGLKRTRVLGHEPGWLRFFCQVLVANGVMLMVLHVVIPDLEQWLQFGYIERFGIMLLFCTAGAVTYGVTLMMAGIQLKQFVR